AQLVAVGRRDDHEMRPRPATVVLSHERNVGIAAISGDVRGGQLDGIGGGRHGQLAHTRSINRRMKRSHSAICSSATNSFGRCACSIDPGPQITVGMPACWNRPASVPNDTLPVSLAPDSDLAKVAI